MRIITVSREFGSGGREFAKRLADHLGFHYYDREIIHAIAKEAHMDEAYVEKTLDHNVIPTIPLTFGRTLYMAPEIVNNASLVGLQQCVIKELAEQGDCVIVGRAADVLLAELHPLRIFIHAGMDARIVRCQARSTAKERISDKEMEKEIRRIDRQRARVYEFETPQAWGDKANYDLCLNTTDRDIPLLSEVIATFASAWFSVKDETHPS